MADRTPDDELIFNIGYGLKRAGLKLAGFEFTRRPPKEAHGSALPEPVPRKPSSKRSG